MIKISSAVWPLCVLFMLTAGCAKDEPIEFKEAEETEQRLVFSAPQLVNSEHNFLSRTTLYSREELVTYSVEDGALAMLWYGQILGQGRWRKDQEHQVEEAVRKWPGLEDASFELKSGGTVRSGIGGARYWRFRPNDVRDCFAINHFWTPTFYDQGGFRDWVNGIYCHLYEQSLTDSEIAEILSRLDVRIGDENPAGTRRD